MRNYMHSPLGILSYLPRVKISGNKRCYCYVSNLTASSVAPSFVPLRVQLTIPYPLVTTELLS